MEHAATLRCAQPLCVLFLLLIWMKIGASSDFATVRVPFPSSLVPSFTNLTLPMPGVYHLQSTQAHHFQLLAHKHRFIQTSQQRHCQYAANAGPFHSDGTCVGTVVVQNRTIHTGTFTTDVGLGRTNDRYWILGHPLVKELDSRIVDFVTGMEWLVYEGVNVAESNHVHRAPRTAVGVTRNDGALHVVVTDGCEYCPHHPDKGYTLCELADLLATTLNVDYAINMDGGSSSVMVQNQHIVNRPTCLDVLPIVCEHAVTSVFCLRG